MGKTFRAYDMSQLLLLPPDLRQWLRDDHLAFFVSDMVEQLDLCAIVNAYEEGRGRPPYHPQMMVKLLIYGYSVGKLSSRKIEQATYDDVAFRVLSGNQQPDHASIAEFRKRHLKELAKLFVQVLQLCERAGLVEDQGQCFEVPDYDLCWIDGSGTKAGGRSKPVAGRGRTRR
jgi:transposase